MWLEVYLDKLPLYVNAVSLSMRHHNINGKYLGPSILMNNHGKSLFASICIGGETGDTSKTELHSH